MRAFVHRKIPDYPSIFYDTGLAAAGASFRWTISWTGCSLTFARNHYTITDHETFVFASHTVDQYLQRAADEATSA